MRRLGGALLLCWLALAPAALAAPPLAGTTVIEAVTSTYMDVELPADVDLFGGTSSPYAIESTGPVTILSLRSFARSGRGSNPRETLDISQMGVRAPSTGASAGYADKMVFQAGRYRLYLHVTGPAKVTLKLPGLTGTTTLRPFVPTSMQVASMTTFPTDLPFTTVIGGWLNVPRRGGNAFAHMVFLGDGRMTLDHIEFCSPEPERQADGGAAFEPGCTGAHNLPRDVQPLGRGTWSMRSTFHGVPLGAYGEGANLTHAGQWVQAEGLMAWTPFADDAPAVDPADPPPPAEPPPAPAPAPAAPAAPPPAVTAGRLQLAAPSAKIRRGRAHATLGCSREGPCHGEAALLGAPRLSAVSLPAGSSARLKLALPRALRRGLARRRSARTTLLLRSRSARGVSETRVPLTLRR
jgi:hypothetical protein